MINNDHTKFLLKYCSAEPKIYNKVSNLLYKNFKIQSAEVSLVCTFIACEILKMNPHKEDFPYCPKCDRITDPGCLEGCDTFKELTKEGGADVQNN